MKRHFLLIPARFLAVTHFIATCYGLRQAAP